MMRTAIQLSVVLALVGGIAFSSAAQGLERHAQRSEEFVPRAGYLRTVQKLALARGARASFREERSRLPTQLRGERKIPVVLVRYRGQPAPFPAQRYRDALFGSEATGPAEATFTQYYRDQSLRRFAPLGEVHSWIELPEVDAYYETDDQGPAFGRLLTFAFEHLDTNEDLGQYDNDGPDGIPNSGDDDGTVDTVVLVHSEDGGECSNQSRNITSHSWHYYDQHYGHRSPFVTDDLRRYRPGREEFEADGSPRRIRIDDYTFQGGIECLALDDPLDTPRVNGIGAFVHEYGHALGLPDLYDRTNQPSKSEGIGAWGLMGRGDWGFPDSDSPVPMRMSAWSRDRLGWSQVTTVSPGQTVELDLESAGVRNHMLRIEAPGTGGDEFFLVEFRDPTWQDQQRQAINWDRGLPGPGVALWHIDERVGSRHESWPMTPKGSGQNDDSGLRPGPNGEHALVAFEQADCRFDLESNLNAADARDLWTYDLRSDPACASIWKTYQANDSGLHIEAVDIANRRARVRVEDAALAAHRREGENAYRLPTTASHIDAADRLRLDRIDSPDEAQPIPEPALVQLESHRLLSPPSEAKQFVDSLRNLEGEDGKAEVEFSLSADDSYIQSLAGTESWQAWRWRSLDAGRRIDELASLLPPGVKLQIIEGSESDRIVRYQQYMRVGSRDVPVLDRGLALTYDADRNWTGYTSDLVPASAVDPAHSAPPLTFDAAVAAAAFDLDMSRVERGLLKDGGEVVHVHAVGEVGEGSGRLARLVIFPLGASLDPIEIVVDSETKEVIDLR